MRICFPRKFIHFCLKVTTKHFYKFYRNTVGRIQSHLNVNREATSTTSKACLLRIQKKIFTRHTSYIKIILLLDEKSIYNVECHNIQRLLNVDFNPLTLALYFRKSMEVVDKNDREGVTKPKVLITPVHYRSFSDEDSLSFGFREYHGRNF